MEPIYVTGAGVVSAIGIGKSDTYQSLMGGLSGIREMKYLQSVHHELPVGEVQLSNDDMIRMLGIDKDSLLTRTALMGRLALREAIEQSGLTVDELQEVSFISATTVGGMDRRELYYTYEKQCDKDYAHALISTHNCADSTEMIADYFGQFASL